MDKIDLEYGASLDSVAFIDRLNYVSPFARLNYHVSESGTLGVGYSSGAPPVDLVTSSDKDSLQEDMAALTLFPRVSLRDSSAYVQRTQTFEVGYRYVKGSRTYTVGAYRETVANGALTMSAPSDFYDGGDLLPELSSNSSVFNIGNYSRMGYMASVSQTLDENYGHAGIWRRRHTANGGTRTLTT